MLWNDSTEDSLKPSQMEWDNEKERELIENLKEMGDGVLEEEKLGVISPKMPHSYYNLLCFTIAYKTGTSLKHVMEMSLFDFVCYMYIVGQYNEKQSPNNNPGERELNEMGLGG